MIDRKVGLAVLYVASILIFDLEFKVKWPDQRSKYHKMSNNFINIDDTHSLSVTYRKLGVLHTFIIFD